MIQPSVCGEWEKKIKKCINRKNEPIASLTLLIDIQKEQCDDKFLIEYSTHERELLGNQVVSLENENPVLLGEMCINDKFVEILTCLKFVLAKVVQSVHPPILGESLLAKVVYYVTRSHFKPPWMEEGSQAKDFKPSACWKATQLNQICYLFLILLCFVLIFLLVYLFQLWMHVFM